MKVGFHQLGYYVNVVIVGWSWRPLDVDQFYDVVVIEEFWN